MRSKRKAVQSMKYKVHGEIIDLYKQPGLIETAGFMGYYDPSDKIIKIDSSLVGMDHIVTIIHELQHALYDRCSFSLAVDPALVEVIIDCTSKMIAENFKLTKR